MRVEIVEWHAVSTWHWELGHELSDELCGICRVSFDGTCPNCKYPGDDCPIILGDTCTHNFHLHCILQWLEQDGSKGLCPMCRQVFSYKLGFGDDQSLQRLIDGHKVMRERADVSEDFEAFDE